jgi:hypothetical protein
MMRQIAILTVALLVFLAGQVMAQTGLSGRYNGVGPAEGMQFSVEPSGDRLVGEFRDSNGATAKIDAGWVDGGAEAVLPFLSRPVFIRILPESIGAVLIVLPISPEGVPMQNEARTLTFVREGMAVPRLPKGYQNPPAKMGLVQDPDVFLISYEFWPPDGVVRGYDAIGPRYQTMLRLFPLVHADVLWKMCLADARPPALAEALRGQGVSCESIVRDIEGAKTKGRFDAYKQDVERDKAELMAAVQCARNYIVKESVCGPASKRVAQAAVAMQTIASALSKYR